jgi:hypothetical protein
VLRFLFEKVASRDLVGSLVAFPVVEHFERVRLKDYQEYTGGFSPKNYPQDDARYGRLGYSLNRYMATYREVSLRILSDDADGVRSLPPGSDLSGVLHEFDGSRLGALRVTSIQELEPEARPRLNAVDRALGVAENAFSAPRSRSSKEPSVSRASSASSPATGACCPSCRFLESASDVWERGFGNRRRRIRCAWASVETQGVHELIADDGLTSGARRAALNVIARQALAASSPLEGWTLVKRSVHSANALEERERDGEERPWNTTCSTTRA